MKTGQCYKEQTSYLYAYIQSIVQPDIHLLCQFHSLEEETLFIYK